MLTAIYQSTWHNNPWTLMSFFIVTGSPFHIVFKLDVPKETKNEPEEERLTLKN
jgi:hypothetical protein